MRELFQTESFLKQVGFKEKGLKGKTVIVQGLGAVGFWTAKHFHSLGGAKIVGVVEKNSAIYDENGLDPDNVKHYFTTHGTLKDYPFAKEESSIYPASFIEKPCDILVTAAIERTVNLKNVEKLQCKVLVEGANGPVTFGADEILN